MACNPLPSFGDNTSSDVNHSNPTLSQVKNGASSSTFVTSDSGDLLDLNSRHFPPVVGLELNPFSFSNMPAPSFTSLQSQAQNMSTQNPDAVVFMQAPPNEFDTGLSFQLLEGEEYSFFLILKVKF